MIAPGITQGEESKLLHGVVISVVLLGPATGVRSISNRFGRRYDSVTEAPGKNGETQFDHFKNRTEHLTTTRI
jgi:hypothetical protein